MHEAELLVTLTAGLSVALVFGYLAHRLHLTPMIGFLVAGVVLGPATPGFVADQHLAGELAEVGVILLMFGVGLHFHLKDLIDVQSIALPGAVGQSLVATILAVILAPVCGLSHTEGLVLGLGLSVASTVVLMRVLMEASRLETFEGRVAVGWLVVEDIFTVVVLVLLPAIARALQGAAGVGEVTLQLVWALAKLGILATLILTVGARVIPGFLIHVARMRSRELFTLAVLAIAMVIAVGSAKIFGVSMALGAFLAGMAVGQSKVSHQAAADALPMRDAFAVLFFVSVGMLFDPTTLTAKPGLAIGTLTIILLGKPLVAIGIVALLGYSARTALTVAVGLAQVGEFSFILADVAVGLKILSKEGQSVLVAGALISITLNPLLFRNLDGMERWLRRHPRLWRLLNRRAEARGRAINEATAGKIAASVEPVNAVVVGHGPVGQTLSRILTEFGQSPIIVDLNVDTAASLQQQGRLAIFGDASVREIQLAAGMERARYLLVTLPDLASRVAITVMARALNPELKILVRARYLNERTVLEAAGASAVCYEEAEVATRLAQELLRQVGADEERLRREIRRVREELMLKGPAETASPTASGSP